jgi:hypothetical protein
VYNLNYTPTNLEGRKLKRNYIWGYANRNVDTIAPEGCLYMASPRIAVKTSLTTVLIYVGRCLVIAHFLIEMVARNGKF